MTRRRFRSAGLALVWATALALAGCGSDSPKASSTTPVTTAPTTGSTDDAPATTNAPPVPASTNADGSVTVTVMVGTDDFDTTGGKRIVSVKKGVNVAIELTDPASDDEYHLHGYDIEVEATKGTPGKISFTADETGQFDLESHTTGKVLLVLVVA